MGKPVPPHFTMRELSITNSPAWQLSKWIYRDLQLAAAAFTEHLGRLPDRPGFPPVRIDWQAVGRN
jgi:hypothetical protein